MFNLIPTLSGSCNLNHPSAPANSSLHFSVHGTGPTKLLFIMGLAGTSASWQHQTLYFGHTVPNSSKYSVLVVDPRGMGKSSAPLARYTTTSMAQDIISVLDHVSWTSLRSVHVIGISLGGMIAQELSLQRPELLASLSLISTAAVVKNTGGLSELLGRVTSLWPKSLEQAVKDTGTQLFPLPWLQAPDDFTLPDLKTMVSIGRPEGIPETTPEDKWYTRFDNNYQRFQAQELHKRLSPNFTTTGFLCQFGAAAMHSKSPAQLKELGDKVGRERIMVLHGTDDNMIATVLGEQLIEMLEPGESEIREGMGHGIPMQDTEWLNQRIQEFVDQCEALEKEAPDS